VKEAAEVLEPLLLLARVLLHMGMAITLPTTRAKAISLLFGFFRTADLGQQYEVVSRVAGNFSVG
jgi:hypothetical protein